MQPSVAEQKLDDALAAEKCLLGGILVDNSRLAEASHVVTPQDFFRVEHGHMFGAMLALAEQNKPIDPVTLRHEMGTGEQAAYIARLTDGVPRSSSVGTYARIVRRHAHERRLGAAAGRVAALAASGELTDWARLELVEALDETEPSEVSPVVDDVALVNLPEPSELIEGRLPGNGLAALIGEPGSGKTFVAADLGASVATGKPWLGARIVRPGPVLYVPGEGAAGFKRRIACWKIAHGEMLDEPIGFHTWTDGAVNLLDGLAVSRFIRHVTTDLAPPPVLCIFDTLARCMVGADENSAKDVGLAIANLDRIAKSLECLVLVVHHTTKSGTTERGSSALRGALDAMMLLTKADDQLVLKSDKQKDGEPFKDLSLRLVPAYEDAPSMVIRLASDVLPNGGLTPTQARLLQVMRDSFSTTGANSQDWQTAATGVSERSYFRARNQLIDMNLIRQDGQFFRLGNSSLPPTATQLPRDIGGDCQ